MQYLLKPWPILWLVIALIITACSFAGGDMSILAGWLFLVWTIPFGIIWWFVLYNLLPKGLQIESIQITGELLSVVVAFIFWFVFVSWLRGREQAKNKAARRSAWRVKG